MIIEIDLSKIERGTHIGQVRVTRGGKTFYRKQRLGQKFKEVESKPKDTNDIDRVVMEMENYIKFDDRVSSDMLDSIGGYTSERYGDINSALREGDLGDYTDLVEDVNNISEFIKNAPKFKGIVYRGMHEFSNSGDFDEFISELTDYDTVELPTFVSCSVERNVAGMFADGERGILFEIESKNGVLLDGASELSEENEVLFDYGLEFDIVSINEKDEHYMIKLKERI